MQDEEIDKLITDVANQHHPPYDDTAWGKMEHLLDQHLPQKKDNRRYILLLLLFLLFGSGITVAIIQPWKNKNNAVAAVNNSNTVQSAVTATTTGTSNNNTSNPQQVVTDNAANKIPVNQQNNNVAAKADNVVGAVNTDDVAAISKNQSNTDKTVAAGKSRLSKSKGKVTLKIKKPVDDTNDNVTAASTTVDIDTDKSSVTDKKDVTVSNQSANNIAETPKVNTSDKKDDNKTAKNTASENDAAKNNANTAVNEKQSKDKRFTSNIALTFSTGVDLSYVDISNPGKIQVAYGAGLRYSLSKHLSIGSGIYVSKKIYTASPYEYKFPGGSTYPNLKSINADCKVYEIPVTLAYNFGAAKNHSWFGAAGLSSLLMKRETYDYFYQTPTGQSYSYAKTITNENKHYFSVLTISGGYQYNLGNRIALLAEPYLKLPLGGVGAGKIKLNSTGLLFTAAVKPFGKVKTKSKK
jgi:hypothetical protein